MKSEQVQNTLEILQELQGTLPQLCDTEARAMLRGDFEGLTVIRKQRQQREVEISSAAQLYTGALISFMSEGGEA